MSAYLLIFAVAFLSATIFPFYSEATLAAQLVLGQNDKVLLVAAASLGNVLGACVNWWMGLFIQRFRNRKWFPVSRRQLARASLIFRRYGMWSLLLAWAPIIGDPLTFIAGALRTPFLPFLILVAIGKTARYAAIAWVF